MCYVLLRIFCILSVQIISKNEEKCMYSGLQFTGQCAQVFGLEKRDKTFFVEIKNKLKTKLEPRYLLRAKTGEIFFVWNDRKGTYLVLKGDETHGLRFCSINSAIFCNNCNDYYQLQFQQKGRTEILKVPVGKGPAFYNDLRKSLFHFQALEFLKFEIE